MRKRLLIMFLTLSIVLSGCGATDNNSSVSTDSLITESNSVNIEIPDLSGVDSESAKQLLLKKSLLPVLEYEYSGTVTKGMTIRTEPKAGTKVNEDSKVIIYVSQGAAGYTSINGTIEWYSLSSYARDEWEFANPQIFQDNLYISCGFTPGTDFQFKNTGFGNASLTDTFDKQVPIRLVQSNMDDFPKDRKVKAGESINFYIVIPLSQLDSEFPTHIACRIVVFVNGIEQDLDVRFSMEWDKNNLGVIDSVEDLFNVNQTAYYEPTSATLSVPTPTPIDTPSTYSSKIFANQEEWASVYLEKLIGCSDVEKCGFPDVNDDGTPEMILFCEKKVVLYTEKNKVLDEITAYNGDIDWIENENVLRAYGGHMGDNYINIYKIANGRFVSIFCGEDSDYDIPFRYYIISGENKEEVTEEEYGEAISKVYDYRKAKEFSGQKYDLYGGETFLRSLLSNSSIDDNYGDTELWEEDEGYYEGDPIDEDMIIPSSSSRYLTYSDVSYLSKKELRLARNEIYARHGRIFDSDDLKNYFNNCFWYEPEYYSWEFDDSWLSEIERANINFLKEVEDSR